MNKEELYSKALRQIMYNSVGQCVVQKRTRLGMLSILNPSQFGDSEYRRFLFPYFGFLEQANNTVMFFDKGLNNAGIKRGSDRLNKVFLKFKTKEDASTCVELLRKIANLY